MVVSHPLAVGIPAAVTTIGAGAALAILLAAPAPKPQVPCGCHQVWIAPVVPMTPQTYDQVMKTAGAIALAGIPLDGAPGGLVVGTPSNLIPAGFPSPAQPAIVVAGSPTPGTPVPEPSTLAILATAVVGLLGCRMIGKGFLAKKARGSSSGAR